MTTRPYGAVLRERVGALSSGSSYLTSLSFTKPTQTAASHSGTLTSSMSRKKVLHTGNKYVAARSGPMMRATSCKECDRVLLTRNCPIHLNSCTKLQTHEANAHTRRETEEEKKQRDATGSGYLGVANQLTEGVVQFSPSQRSHSLNNSCIHSMDQTHARTT
jgi:hypothetical protein